MPPKAADTDKQQAADGQPSAAAAAAADDVQTDEHLQDESFTMATKFKDDTDGGVDAGSPDAEDAEEDGTRTSWASDGSLTAEHEAGHFLPGAQSADFVCHKRLKSSSEEPRKIIRLVVEAKDSVFGAHGQAWKDMGRFQLLHYVGRAALHNIKASDYFGDVHGFGTSLQHFSPCKVTVAGIITLSDDENHSYRRADGQLSSPEEINLLVRQAENRVRGIKGCSGVDKLMPGDYLVGNYAMTANVHQFLPYPMESVYPEVPGTNAIGLTNSGYAALQGLVLICAGTEASRWEDTDVKARIQTWQYCVKLAESAVYSTCTQEMWADSRLPWTK